MRKFVCIASFLALTACTPTQIHQFRNAIICRNHGMVNCVETVDKNGDGSLSGDKAQGIYVVREGTKVPSQCCKTGDQLDILMTSPNWVQKCNDMGGVPSFHLCVDVDY